jgi:uncharacterized protein (TIGR02145 family)
MKKILILVSLFILVTIQAQTQDTLYVWKAGQLVIKQSIKPADMDSITFKRPPVNPNGINIPGPNVTDIDGNTYQSVTNCGQTWTKQNLNVSSYSDGTLIPQVTDPQAWRYLITGAWCYYVNNTANGPVYGKLYNWYAVAGIYDAASAANPVLLKKLAPTGWHVPAYAEWTELKNCLGGEAVAGGKMKATGTIQAGTGLWQDPNANSSATNESGFTSLPAGFRYINGPFGNMGFSAVWWCTSETGNLAVQIGLNFDNTFLEGSTNKELGYSVRCLKD